MEEPLGLELDFQPLEIGNYWIYQVDEIQYFGEGDSESYSFYFRDKIMDSFENEEGLDVFRLVRSKSIDGVDWQNESVFTLQMEKNSLVKKEGNQVEVTLVFPPMVGKSWDANVYDAKQADFYAITEMGIIHSIGTNQVNTLTVLQADEDDAIILRDKRYQVFGKGIGLVESYEEILQYCSRNECLGEQIIEEGRFRHLSISEYGKN